MAVRIEQIKAPNISRQNKSSIRAFLKLTGFLLLALSYFILTMPLYPFFLLSPFTIRRVYNYILSFYAKILLKMMGIRVQTDITTEIKDRRGKLLVSNHMSYIDVLIAAAYNPGCFVTSVEMKKTPFLGQICQLGGCVFVERRNKKNLKNEIKEITQSLENGLDVYVYPEATSTNGEEVIRFRRPLFHSAIDSKAPVQPFTLNYLNLNDQKVDRQNRDEVCWYGDMTFFDHLWNIFSLSTIDVSTEFHNSIETTDPLNQDVAQLSELSHKIVSQSFNPFQ